MTLFQKTFSQKFTASILIICLAGLTAGPILFYPGKAQALGCPVTVAADIPKTESFSIETAWEGLKATFRAENLATLASQVVLKAWDNAQKLAEWASGVLLNLLLHQILAMLTNDIVDWIQNGGELRFMSEGLGNFLERAADNAIGNFIDQYLGAGWLCEPFDIDIKIALLDVPTFEEEARCSLSDIIDNIDDFYDDFSKGGWKGWIELTKPQNNFYGALLLAQGEKMRVAEEAKREAETDAQMGQGFLGQKDCVWHDRTGKLIKRQKDVRGHPKLPDACKPNPQGLTPGVIMPCKVQCQTKTPASVINEITKKTVTNYYDRINAQIAGATAKSGPFQIYVTAIINALINRVMKEGLDLVKGDPNDPGYTGHMPGYGDIGASANIPKTADPQSILQGKNDATALSGQLNLIKQNLENKLLEEQKNNLAVLKLIPPTYSEILPILDNIITTCSSILYASYIDWAKSQKEEIEKNTIPSFNDRVNQLEKVDIPKTINTVNDVNTVLVSIQNYTNKADAWLNAYEQTEGKQNNLQLQTAETEMKTAENKAIQDTQKVLVAINGTALSTDFTGLNLEAQNANANIINQALNLKQEKGDAAFPDPDTLYAELETAQALEDEANSKLNICQN
jgi:hypothetical protein